MALAEGELSVANLPSMKAVSLGPLMELAQIFPLIGEQLDWLNLGEFNDLWHFKSQRQTWYQERKSHFGFIRIAEFDKDISNETDFCVRARRAAGHAGFTTAERAQLVAAILEFSSNITEHSGREETGYIAFRARRGEFEFIVSDSGIGVLESLKQNPQYANLTDAGRALELVLTDGISRHHQDAQRGRGFRPLFVGLANISDRVRFRSVDHSREIFRREGGGLEALTVQRTQMTGFCCSIVCRSDAIHP